MVGLHVYNNLDGIDTSNDHTATLQLEEWHGKKEYFNDGILSIDCSFYKGYPINQYKDEDVIILYEGMIYNRTDEEVFEFCKSIPKKDNDSLFIKNQIANFVDLSDGDYIILIYNIKSKQYIIFNDLIGRLPFYYYSNSKLFIGGRSIPFILHNIPQICLNKNALTEFLMIEFLIGKDTFFKDIKRLSPAEILIINSKNDSLQIIAQFAIKESFIAENLFKDKEEALSELYKEYTQATKNRIETLESQGYNILNTLSGGFDSRAVFGSMNNITQNFTNVTYEYIQDESIIAKQLLEKTNSKARFVKLSFNNEADYFDSSLIFRTGCSVNIYTSSVCYNDSLFMKKVILNNTNAVFGGFGGEFIRHPYYPLTVNPYTYLCYYCSCLPIQMLLPIFNISSSDFKKFMMSTLSQYEEKSKEGIYKHLYNEYYRNYVVGAGEDRMRMFVWTLHPLMSASFLKIIRKRVPLKWSNFQFFIDFISRIDSRLLDIPIFGKSVNLKDKDSIKQLTPTNQKRITALIIIFLRKYILRFYDWRIRDKSNSIEFDKFESFYQKLDFYKPLFNFGYIKKKYNKWPISLKRGLLSITMYLYELEKNYKYKLTK
jgi:hypothetical protein